MFVSNLADGDADATVTLHTDKLHRKDISEARDAVSREAIVVDHGTIRLRLGPWTYRVVRMKLGARE
jgi:hypothetical protein